MSRRIPIFRLNDMTGRGAALSLATALAMVLAACGGPDVAGVGAGDDWSAVGGGADESSFSRLETITADNVSSLGLAWSLDLDDEQTLEATPLAVDGILYFTGSRSTVYAVDGASGKLLWKHDPGIQRNRHKMRMIFAVNRGVAYAGGRIFVGAFDGRLLALDAKSGKLVWETETVDPASAHTITGAPRAFRDMVIIGNGGGDAGARGYVTAYDQATGKQRWRFHTVPGSPQENAGDPVMESAAKSWNGEYWKTGTGGTVWNGMTYDAELDRLYIGTGNSGPYNPEVRSPGGGDNLFLASIVALEAKTGKYIWHYQVNPREAWDFKATMNMILADLKIDGQPRKVLMQAPTNGFFYVLDRTNGKLLSAEKIGKVTWAERIDLATGRPVEAPNIRYEKGESLLWPSPAGAHNWQAMAYSPATGLVYIPYMQIGARYSLKGEGASMGGLSIAPVIAEDEDGKGALIAWDPVAQKPRWKVQHQSMFNGGVLATAGGVVFQGLADGRFVAYNAASGNPLWTYNAGLGIVAAPSSYVAGGKQYVTILVGYGGGIAPWPHIFDQGWKFGAQPRRLLTFAIGGKARLPKTAPSDMKLYPVDDPAITVDRGKAQRGGAIYNQTCAGCHGLGLYSPGTPGPDLRESALALDPKAFREVLHGALVQRGMPSYELSDADIEALYHYVRAGSRAALKDGKVPLAAGPTRF